MKKILLTCAAIALPALLLPVTNVSAQTAPEPQTKDEASANNGFLKVFSSKEEQADGDKTVKYVHTPYDIRAADGTKVKMVKNSSDTPDKISLPPGDYIIAAQSEQKGPVRIPVTIKSRQTTQIGLDGTAATYNKD